MTTQTPSNAIEVSPEAIDQQVIEARRLIAWERDRAQIEDFFNQPMKYISAFWQEYKPIAYLLGTTILVLVALKIVLGVIEFVTDLPLIGGFLELVGIGYSIWFFNRYLWKVEARQELSQTVEVLKQDVIGVTEPVIEEFKSAIEPEQTLS
ncbi:MAG TPA: CAAD domain-containing protein [Leptolyngbya sp.]|jgi:hypothetical protein|nr:CAAD domain-containing protein [Leptolyngbya sp.]